MLHDALVVERAGTAAFGLWTRMVCWSARSSPELLVPPEVVAMFDGEALVDRLVEVDLAAQEPGGYRLINGTLANGKPYWRVRLPPTRPRIPTDVRVRVYVRDGGRCRHCGTTENLSIDHVIPRSKGGPDTEDNLQVLCVPCNSSKGVRT